jgi:DNA-binding FadR family transcriptional regulator
MDLKPVAKTSASMAVFEQLVDELVAGRLRPGDALPAERALTERLNVNRQAVREALQRLAQAGLVRISQGETTKALDYRRTAGLDLLPRLLLDPHGAPNIEVVRSIMEMRACIGPDVARLAAVRAPADVPARLVATVERMTEARGDLATLARLDLSYWDRLIDAADNIAYRLAFNSLRAAYEPLAEALSAVLVEELTDTDEHLAIARAVADGEPETGAAAARRLLSKGSVAIAELLAVLPHPDPGPDNRRRTP